MADHIIVDSGAIDTCITRYNNALANVEEAHEAYLAALRDLERDWTGTAYAVMFTTVSSVGNKIQKSFATIKDAISELTAFRNSAQSTEGSVNKKSADLNEGSNSPFI